ncbi:MAG: hypothetical protein JWR05_3492 [Mucilaginibacter sp.]|nr:hypothetical protein [Mucilaginibacter sp.]
MEGITQLELGGYFNNGMTVKNFKDYLNSLDEKTIVVFSKADENGNHFYQQRNPETNQMFLNIE